MAYLLFHTIIYFFVVGKVEGVTFVENLMVEEGPFAVCTNFRLGWGDDNEFRLTMEDNVYVGAGAGEVRVGNDSDCEEGDIGPVIVDDGTDFQIKGSTIEFLEDNSNLDISDVLSYFADSDDDDDDDDD